ncbi:MAG: hypothetical protein RR279_00130 [Alistipes sp.]
MKLSKVIQYTVITVLWCAVIAYVIYSTITTRQHCAKQCVERVEIHILDSLDHGQLVTEEMVRQWMAQSGIHTLGAPMRTVNLPALERMITRNGFVDQVRAYISYSGVLRIDVSQRQPLLRLLVNGYNVYLSETGYAFTATESSLYVPVVTGSYQPPFAASWRGPLALSLQKGLAVLEREIAQIETQKYPFFRRERENNKKIRDLQLMRIKKSWFESQEAFDDRVKELIEKKKRLRRTYAYEKQLIDLGISRIDALQEEKRYLQKKLEKSYEDFSKLITFVKQIEQDDFWKSEIVQIVATSAASGALEVELIPRSGSHTILFGRIEAVDEKLDKLYAFYRSGMKNLGWNTYRTVNIKYKEQVVCTK